MWKRTISLYWNLGISEFLFSFCFFNLLLCPTTNCWAVVERTGSMIQCWCSFIAFFLLQDQKELHEKVKSWWRSLRGLNWQHSNSYIMSQLTDLSCHTVLIFVKFNMLKKFWSIYLQILREHVTLHDFPVEQRHSVPLKYRETFF